MSTAGCSSQIKSVEYFSLQSFTGAALFGATGKRSCELLRLIPPMPNSKILHAEIAHFHAATKNTKMIFDNHSRKDVIEILQTFCQQGIPFLNVFEPSVTRIEGLSVFQLMVYREACSIPHGETRPYSWLSDRIRRIRGGKNAARAVGGAMRSNPFAPLIPCHRVVSKSGELGGYMGAKSQGSWQIELKTVLLELEGLYKQPDLFNAPIRDLSFHSASIALN